MQCDAFSWKFYNRIILGLLGYSTELCEAVSRSSKCYFAARLCGVGLNMWKSQWNVACKVE